MPLYELQKLLPLAGIEGDSNRLALVLTFQSSLIAMAQWSSSMIPASGFGPLGQRAQMREVPGSIPG